MTGRGQASKVHNFTHYWFSESLGASPQLDKSKKRRHSSSTSKSGQPADTDTNHYTDKGADEEEDDTPGV